MINPYVKILRPHHWLKNLMLLFPPFFAGMLASKQIFLDAILPLVAFSLGASAIYIFNDVRDAKKDKLHPRKKNRPIPSGSVSPKSALMLGNILLLAALLIGSTISKPFFIILFSYLLISCIYTLKLKNIVVVDLFCVSLGFVLRLEAGGQAFSTVISDWLFLNVFLLAIFLSTGKRLFEKRTLGEAAKNHRLTLGNYPDGFLEGAMFMSGGAVLVTYAIYVIQHPYLIYSVPVCCFGLFQYIYLVKSGKSGDPTESMLKDPALFITSIIWVSMMAFSLYYQ